MNNPLGIFISKSAQSRPPRASVKKESPPRREGGRALGGFDRTLSCDCDPTDEPIRLVLTEMEEVVDETIARCDADGDARAFAIDLDGPLNELELGGAQSVESAA